MNTPIPDYTKPNWPCVSGKRKQIEMIDVINGKWDYDNDRGM